jgi:hypothetical protein
MVRHGENGGNMKNEEASPVAENRGAPKRVLVYVTRETIMRILLRYEKEVNGPRPEISPFIDRVMEDLAKEDRQDVKPSLDNIFRANLFGRSFGGK